MGSFSFVHWIVVAVVVLLLFGRGRISEFMGDFGKGIGAFRKGLAEDDTTRIAPPQSDAEAAVAQSDSASQQSEPR